MSISQLFGSVKNGITESGTKAAAKLLALASIPAVALVSLESAKSPEQAFLENLDGKTTTVFQSVPACMDKGFSKTDCETSQQKALDFSNNLLAVKYSSNAECVANHGKCDQHTWLQPTIISAGEYTAMSNIRHSVYKPPVIAWQAATTDLHIAAPLYPAAKEGLAVRKDGKTLDLNS